MGPRLGLAVIFSIGAAAALGQATPCPDIANDAERLACYDRALRPDRTPAPSTQSAPPPATTAPAPAAAAPAGAAVAPAATTAAPAAAAPPTPVTAAPAATPAPSAATDQVVTISIVAVSIVTGRSATFTAADGTVWVQNDSQTLRNLPETPFDAELKEGALGSRFLLPKGQSRSIRVRLSR